MDKPRLLHFIKNVLENMPKDWLQLTTHRLDIYNEQLAKTDFLHQFNELFTTNTFNTTALEKLPTAYDYIRLGHPLSCILEWGIANLNGLKSENVISFSSETMPILAILRTNLLNGKQTQIVYKDDLPKSLNLDILKRVYKYQFDIQKVTTISQISEYNGSTIYISQKNKISTNTLNSSIDFYVNIYKQLGSVLLINSNEDYVSEIQHVRRRETIAMTPTNCFLALTSLVNSATLVVKNNPFKTNKTRVLNEITKITEAFTTPIVGSSGLSVQYAIMMGLVDYAQENYSGKAIKFVVPPNCYGGTNDQARRVTACLENVEVVDLPVDGNHNMVQSINTILDTIALEDAVAFIIAEIPTNPRVEVPDLVKLKAALCKIRKTVTGENAIEPVFILDQTFCPNVHFLGEGEILSAIRALSYASGSKFPSGGKCTAGYVVGNNKTSDLMKKIEIHLQLCNNEATPEQFNILAMQLPTMNNRIATAYKNTREFVDFIQKTMPEAKINFVSEELAAQGFTPSVFSLDLPTKGNSVAEKQAYKQKLNHQLINGMITKIPNESKHCVSYGQLKGSYWTIPATSTQGTTKEGDKDYITRVSVSPELDLEQHKKVFLEFVAEI